MLALRRLAAPAAGFVLAVCFAAASADQPSTAFKATLHKVLPILKTLTPLGSTDPNKVLHIGVGLRPAHAAELQQFCDAVSNPRSQMYRHFIKPNEVGARFGAAKSDVDAVVAYLKQNGITVTLVAPNRMEVLATATVAQAKAAFQTDFSDFKAPNPVKAGKLRFIANTTPAMVPEALAKVVIDVSGLENYSRPMPMGQTTSIDPNLMRALYNTAAMYGAGYQGQGRTIGISNWDGFRLSNVPLYIAAFNLPVPAGGAGSNITVKTFNGGSGSLNANAEGDLDIQMVLGMAPLANIIDYDGGEYGGPDFDIIGVWTMEASDNLCDIITESYGHPFDPGLAAASHNQHMAMTAQGITYLVSSGDRGTNLEIFPVSDLDPDVLLVGGTCATVDDTTGARISEVAWSGSGGGWAVDSTPSNVLPPWQKGNGVPTNINFRLVPDVALHASGQQNSCGDTSPFYVGGSILGGCGTSFSSPLFAGCLGIMEQRLVAGGVLAPSNRLGRINDLIYLQNGRPDVWHDITVGNNGTLPDGNASNCTPGWDFVTGWGSPDFTAFMSSLLTQTTTTAAAAPNPSQYGQPVVLSAAVNPPPGGGTVTFLDGATTLGTVNVGQTLTHAFGAVGLHVIAASYSGDLSHAASSGTTTLVVNQAVTILVAEDQTGDIGSTVDLKAKLTRQFDGAPLPGMSVAFTVTGEAAGSATTDAGGVATLSYTIPFSFGIGPHTISTDFAGDANYGSSTDIATLHVNPAPTTTTVVANPNPGVVRQSITITPTVTPTPDGGSIAIKDDGNLIGTVGIGGSLTWKFSTAKTHVITAEFSGDTKYLASSGSVDLEIDKAPTQTTLTANPAIGATGAPTTLHAVVICTVDGTPPDPPGTMDFWDTSAPALDLGTEPMGTDLTYTPWHAGTHALEARYSGNDNFLPSTGPLSYAIVPYLLPNLYWDSWNGQAPVVTLFRPEEITVDNITLHDVLTYNGAGIGPNLVIQAVRLQKVTPSLKCTGFVSGPGAGLNTNFDTGLKKATDADLDKDLVNIALGIPQGKVALGERALLFSPPGTTYTLSVVYVIIDARGRPGAPQTVTRVLKLMVPSRDFLRREIEYFSNVAAGATQKPKITDDVVEKLNDALNTPDDLGALVAIETVIAETATDFSTLINTADVRFVTRYLIDSDEEPIGCLLIEQANALLWH